MSENTDYTNAGALPTLDSKGEVLGTPTSKLKSKTNVGKFAILGLVLVGFVFIIGGLLFYQKHKRASAPVEPLTAKNEAVKPGFESKIVAVESDSIEKAKADIKKKQEEEQAQLKAIEEAQAQARAQAEAEAAKNGQASGGQQRDQSQSQQHGNQPAPLTPMERKMAGSVLLDSTGAKLKPDAQISEKDQQQREVQARLAALGASQGGNPAYGAGAGQPPTAGGGGGIQNGDGLATKLQPTVLQARSAGRLPNLDYLLKRGTSIPCALKTGIDTTLPGFVICNVINNVYSANGKTLLIERGATVFGEQQSNLKQGQERTFVVWSRIDNPNGVFANIDSPATDQMGYSGIPGVVDTHFWQRFGGAIMLSLIKDFSQAYAERTVGSNNTAGLAYNNTSQASQDMAAEALRNSINIPPTLVVLPAKVINVMVARDVSFENVFEIVE